MENKLTRVTDHEFAHIRKVRTVDDPLLNVQQVAEYLQVHEQTVRRYGWSGVMTAYSIGKTEGDGTLTRAFLSDVQAVLKPVPLRPVWKDWGPRPGKPASMKEAIGLAKALLTEVGYEFD